MPYRDADKQKQAQHDWYLKNKEITHQRGNNSRKERQKWFAEYKQTLICSKCGMSGKGQPKLLSFHHTNPEIKDGAVSKMVCDGRPKEIILDEISKCVILCANCHAIEHNHDISKNKKISIVNRKWYKDHKSNISCDICGETNPVCLHFHHKNPKEKMISISQAIRQNWSIKDIEAELDKCVCLCANCHMKIH
jgi:hypothetical protein